MLVACYYIYDCKYTGKRKQLGIMDFVQSNPEIIFFNVARENIIPVSVKFYVILDDDYKKNYISLRLRRKYRRFKFKEIRNIPKKEKSNICIHEFSSFVKPNYIGTYTVEDNTFTTAGKNIQNAKDLIQYLEGESLC